jgi:hypothetical protein
MDEYDSWPADPTDAQHHPRGRSDVYQGIGAVHGLVTLFIVGAAVLAGWWWVGLIWLVIALWPE